MEKSAGILFIKDNKILLCHPTRHPEYGSYSIPKGHIENNEEIIDAAIRETKEEIGYDIDKSIIKPESMKIIDYKNKKGKTFKKVFYFPVFDNNIPDTFLKEKLQLDEVDWAGFLNYKDAEERIFWRFKEMLDFIKE